MAKDGEEAVGSMGTDTPLAVLSNRPQFLYNYFKQLFAQVTNPPIDSTREEMVMSLESYIGSEQNLLAETPKHCHMLKLPCPVLTNAELEKVRQVSFGDFRAVTLPMTFPISAGPNGCWLLRSSPCARKRLRRFRTGTAFWCSRTEMSTVIMLLFRACWPLQPCTII